MNKSIFETSAEFIKKIGTDYGYSDDLLDNFLTPNRIIEVSLPVVKDNKIKLYKGFRVQHNNSRGPYKGGIRFHEEVDMDEVMALSLWMSLKTAIANIPFGGGKGGVIVDPKKLSEKELEDLSREFTKELFDVLGPDKDVPAPDVNTNPKIINWMADEYVSTARTKDSNLSDETLYGTFTGKSIANHGLDGREEATGFGGAVVLREIAKKLKKNPNLTTVAIQGFGNVGYYFAKFASDFGFKIVCVSDSKGAITDKDSGLNTNLDIDKIYACKLEKGMVAGCYCVGGVCDINDGKVISNEDLITLPVDVLVPSALGGVINESNMQNIQARVIIEMANGPITPTAHEYLNEKGVIIVPDVLANSAGVTASFLEWRQNTQNIKMSKLDVLKELERIMTSAFDDVYNESEREKKDLLSASYGIALKRILGEKTS